MNDLINELRTNNYKTMIREPRRIPILTIDGPLPSNRHESIWLGHLIPPQFAIEVIKIAIKHWSFLKYILLSSDTKGDPPDFVHQEIFLGGNTYAALSTYNLSEWNDIDFQNLNEDMSNVEFHNYIRQKYGS